MAATLTWTAGIVRSKLEMNFVILLKRFVKILRCCCGALFYGEHKFLFQKILRSPHTDVFGHMNVPEIPEVLKFSTKYSVSAISAAPLKCVLVQCASKSLKLFLQVC